MIIIKNSLLDGSTAIKYAAPNTANH